MSERLSDGIETLPNIGPARAGAFFKLGIRTLSDLVYHFPRAYENRGDIRLLSQAPADCRSAVLLTVGTEPRIARLRGRLSLLKFNAYDDSGICEITYFNQDYLKARFTPGATFRFYGKVAKKGKHFVLSSPESEPWNPDSPLPDLIPVYRLCEGLSEKLVEKSIQTALAAFALSPDPLPEEIRLSQQLCTLSFALRNIHNPADYTALAAAKKRLIFDEFFTFALGLSLSRKMAKEETAPRCEDGDLSDLLALLPYRLSGAQTRVIEEIRHDMEKEIPMSRMVSGDVGCGKTVCAAAAMFFAVKSGHQAALMAPTEILARQHYETLAPLFAALHISVALLIGATPAAEKRKIRAALRAEEPEKRLCAVIGTQALLSDGVEFADPGLIVTDEQHRFGVRQRAVLCGKSRHAHMLVMSATPIPRSLSLALFGDLDLSRIDEMPAGRKRVDTFCVDGSYRERLNAFIAKQCAAGGQVYVVCPSVEDRDTEPDELLLSEIGEYAPCPDRRPVLKSAVATADELQTALPDLCVAYVHGQMKSKEKEAIMSDFESGKIDVLVSTTVIEVGVNVPNATLMIVEDADRFGLSQLHQLRGRVGRGAKKSYCVLVSESAGNSDSPAGKRLHALCETHDGFSIAEKDLALRGPGDFFAASNSDTIRQSGGVRFRLADLCDDAGLLNTAFLSARELIQRDPDLRAHPDLRDTVSRMFSPDGDTIS